MGTRRRGRSKPSTELLAEGRKVYVETSVWGMTLDNQPRALREPTMRFLHQCGLGIFVPCISTVVLQEIALAGPVAARMVREINKLGPITLELSDRSEELA